MVYNYRMEPSCDICTSIQANPANLLITRYWLVILSHDQGYLGRCYVTLRDHKGSLGQLSDAEWLDYKNIVRRLEKACMLGLGATLCNWTCLMNNAYQRKPCQPHVHWHFRPRYDKPVTINGMTFGDPDFGLHYDRNQKRTVDDKTFEMILSKLAALI